MHAIDPDAGYPGAKMSNPKSPPRLNFTGMPFPALTMFTMGKLSTGWKNPVKFSTTVTVTVHVAEPAEFSAVIVTVCAPVSSGVPADGDCVTTTEHPVVTTSFIKLGVGA